MDYYSMSDIAIAEEIGSRLKALRLRKDLTRQQVADATLLSLNTVKALEAGKGKLSNFIAVLRELGALDELDNFLPKPEVSPLQLARLQGKKRRRASGRRGKSEAEESEW